MRRAAARGVSRARRAPRRSTTRDAAREKSARERLARGGVVVAVDARAVPSTRARGRVCQSDLARDSGIRLPGADATVEGLFGES